MNKECGSAAAFYGSLLPVLALLQPGCGGAAKGGSSWLPPPEEPSPLLTTISLGDFLEAKSTGSFELVVTQEVDGYLWYVQYQGNVADDAGGIEREIGMGYGVRNGDFTGSFDIATYKWLDSDGTEAPPSMGARERSLNDPSQSTARTARSGTLTLERIAEGLRLVVKDVEMVPAPALVCDEVGCQEQPVAPDDLREPVLINGEIWGEFVWSCRDDAQASMNRPRSQEEMDRVSDFCRAHTP